jgi:phospholipid transport system transporter-binding protein
VLKLPAVLNHDQAKALVSSFQMVLLAEPAGVEPVVADATNLSRFDSSALAVLLACRRQAQALGRSFYVRGLPPRLRQLASLYGIAELIPDAP